MADEDNKILYGLYAVVVHSGKYPGGYYSAYVRRRPVREQQKHPKGCSWKYNANFSQEGVWYFTRDDHISQNHHFDNVKGCQAYLLFYELLPII